MHLLFLIYDLGGGGAERFTATMANHWAAQGHQISIVTLADAPLSVYPLRPEISVTSAGISRDTGSVGAGIGNTIRRIRRIRQVLRQLRPDAALGMMTTSSCLLALAGRGLGIRLVGTERAYPPALPLGRGWQMIRRLSYRLLDAVVAQTEEGAAWLKAHTWARQPIALPNPIALPLPEAEPALDPAKVIPVEAKLLLAVGRLSDQKQFHVLIGAFANLAPGHPDWRLAIIGEGPCRAALQAQVATLGLTQRIALPGRVGNPGAWMQRADLTAMTSAFEGFPNALLEAMAHGVPGVSFDCKTGPTEIIRHGVNGLLVPEGEVANLIEALGALMQDPDRRAAMAAEALQLRETFALGAVSDRWLAVLGDRQPQRQSAS